MDCSPPGSPVDGIFQARILEWVATPEELSGPGDLPDPGIAPVSPVVPALRGRFFTTEPCPAEKAKVEQPMREEESK